MPATDALQSPVPPAEERSLSAFDLADMRSPDAPPDFSAVQKRCDAAAGRPGEIVVCAPDPERERLRALPDTYVEEPALPPARWSLGDGVSLDVHVDAAQMPDGTVSNRVMVGVKMKF
ncbi:hypothetical protein [Novosphingobium mangrovi (ex Huang et al. 2023)]|uniref:Uncharacterized protein n=1 Tax=Novosphingobium mangrovi (ex Huang et al. 2023) TaxID=2976432 RepID=A0ABT2I0D6_9SPHN|nr:hypothetical protein [Novosphingobium mangrovi (ex Huang et al. 2023)]MCT2398266.1 hypothetical protein [Novosphingobium mangrovi (ex Huang et al. 2023)]